MPSPNNGKRHSSTSLGRHSVAAIRRGDIKISDPIPLPKDKVDEALRLGQELNHNSCRSNTPATDGTWPRRSTPPENTTHPGSEGDQRDALELALNRDSAGPSVLLSTMSSKTSLKQGKSGGFRANIRSLFGSKRHRSTLQVSYDRSYHISVSAEISCLFLSSTRPEDTAFQDWRSTLAYPTRAGTTVTYAKCKHDGLSSTGQSAV
jgi:hypothetical protein